MLKNLAIPVLHYALNLCFIRQSHQQCQPYHYFDQDSKKVILFFIHVILIVYELYNNGMIQAHNYMNVNLIFLLLTAPQNLWSSWFNGGYDLDWSTKGSFNVFYGCNNCFMFQFKNHYWVMPFRQMNKIHIQKAWTLTLLQRSLTKDNIPEL